MTKKSFDFMKWWPLLTAIFTLISASAVLFYRVADAEEKVKGIEAIKISQAKMETELDFIYRAVKDAKKNG